MGMPTDEDWGQIHKMAFEDDAFRKLLESDPRKALDQFCEKQGKAPFSKIVDLPAAPDAGLDQFLHEKYKAPPACC